MPISEFPIAQRIDGNIPFLVHLMKKLDSSETLCGIRVDSDIWHKQSTKIPPIPLCTECSTLLDQDAMI